MSKTTVLNLWFAGVMFGVGVTVVGSASAAFIASGDVSPWNPYAWDDETNALIGYQVGSYFPGSGSVKVTGGELLSRVAYLGYDSNSVGSVTVGGGSARWRNLSSLYVGRYGGGYLTVSGQGDVHCGAATLGLYYGSRGTAEVMGDGSIWACGGDLRVGDRGRGSLRIADGGVVTSRSGYVGYGASSASNYVTVDGEGSSWTATGGAYGSRLAVGWGDGSWGKLEILNGGYVQSDSGCVGRYDSDAFVSVRGEGSTWIVENRLDVGSDGTSRLTISEGGLVAAESLYTKYGALDSSVRIGMGGMLALAGEADACVADFLDLVTGGDAIECWSQASGQWLNIANASIGEDYDLRYHATGDLAGFTVLVVPEPTSLAMVALGMSILVGRRRRK